MPRGFRRQKRVPVRQVIVAVAASAVLAAGAGLGAVTQGLLGGNVGVVASYGVRLDTENYTQKDLKLALEQGAAGGRDINHIALAARLRVGETAIADIPLANTGHESTDLLARFTAPGAMFDLGRFWNTATRSTSPTETNSPSPAPVTSVSAQTSDTLPALSGPPGIAGISPQVSLGVPTTSSPGLPSSTPQAVGGLAATNSAPSGSQAITAQSVAASAVNAQPSGALVPNANILNLTSTTTQPGGTLAPSAQNAAASAVTSKPSGLPDPTAQVADGTSTNAAPSGGVTISAQVANGTSTNTAPLGGVTISAQVANGTSTNTAPSGGVTIAAQVANGTSTNVAPSGSVTITAQAANGTLTNTAPSGGVAITAQTANGTLTNTLPSGLAVSTVTQTIAGSTVQPSGAGGVNGVSLYYASTLSVDTDGDGDADTVNVVLVDVTADGAIDWIELSSDDATFGEGTVLELIDGVIGANNDELRLALLAGTAAYDLSLGALTFTVSFPDSLSGGNATLSTASKTWYTGSFTIDADADGDADDAINFAISDTDADGTFDMLDLSLGDAVFGEGTLGNALLGAAQDERFAYGTGSDLLGWWKGNGNANDSSGNGNNGTLNGGAAFAGGKLGQAFSLDGVDDYVSTTLTIDQSATSPGATFAAWVYPTSTGAGRHQLISTDDCCFDWSILRDGSAWYVFTGRETTAEGAVDTGFSVDLNTWQHVAAVWDPSTGATRFYKNGVEFSTSYIGYDSASAALWIGQNPAGGGTSYSEYFAGLVDDVRVLDTPLSAAQVAALASQAGWSAEIAYGTAGYTFTTAFDAVPAADVTDATLTARTWFTGSFTVDADADGTVDDTVRAVFSDADSNGLFDTLDLSTDDATYGEGSLTNGVTGSNQDERITASADVRLGDYYTFAVAFDANPPADASDVSITAKTWFTGGFTIDAAADGTANDTTSFTLSDANSDGGYDTLDLSSDDTTFGEGLAQANVTGADEDERLTASGDVRLGASYTFTAAFDANPPDDVSDATLTSKTWFTGSFTIDAAGDGSANDTVSFALSDADSNGLYDTVDLSSDDGTYGEALAQANITGSNEDERLTASGDVRLGANYTFTLAFDATPPADANDATLTSKTWFTGSFTIDAAADGSANDTVSFALSDADSNGLYDTVDLSSDDATYGETLAQANITGSNEDERLTASGDVLLGDYYTFAVAFDANPPADASDATLTAKTWFTGSFTIDAAGDGSANDTVSIALSDADSNGLYDTIDLSTDDGGFGEGTLDNAVTGADQDERRVSAANIRLGDYYTFEVDFDVNPATVGDSGDVTLTSLTWYTTTLTIDADADGDADDTVNVALADNTSNGVFDAVDISIADTTYQQGTPDASAAADGSDDAAISSTPASVTLGSYAFSVAWSSIPATALNDVSITAATWFRGNLAIDVDANGTAGSTEVAVALTDTDSDGRFDALDVQTDDSGSLTLGFGEGTLSGQTPRQTASADDERLASSTGGGNTGGSADVRLGSHYLFTIAFDNNPAGDSSDVRATSKTWYTAQAAVDVNADATAGSTEVALVLGDADSDGRYDTLDIQTDDSGSLTAGFGESTLSGQTPRQTGANDDERLGIGTGGGNSGGSADVRLGAYYLFTVAFDNIPPDAGTDLTITSKTWYAGTFTLDADADGLADDTVNIVLTDSSSNGLYPAIDLSLGDTTFGQGSLVDGTLASANDARLTSTGDLNVGTAAYLFGVAHSQNPGAASPAATLTAKTHFEGSFVFDVNADGDLDGTDETLYFGLSDLDSNGLYDAMDLSLADQTFAEGSLTNEHVEDGDDERVTTTTVTTVGGTYAVEISWDNNPAAPGDDNDARILLISDGTVIVYTALNSWQVDADGDEVADDHVYFVLSDTNSDAIVDTIDLSIGDTTFGEFFLLAELSDSVVDFGLTNNANDERFTLSGYPTGKVVRLGTHNFLVSFDAAVNADADDARIAARWYTGSWPVDVDNDDVDNTIDFVQVDSDSDGIFTVIEIDGDDSGGYAAAEVHVSAGSRWRPPEGVRGVDDMGSHSTLAAVDADTLLVAFYDATDDELLFSKSTDGGASWDTAVTVDSAGDPGRYASLKALSSTVYLVSYYEAGSGDLRVARTVNGGATWAATTVDSTGDVGQYTSLLALDSSTALVSFYDATNSRLKVAKTADAGATWPALSVVEVDNAADVGKYSALAGVRSNAVFAAYYDATNGDLKLAKSLTGGATWTVSGALDSTGDVGQYASAVAEYDSTPDDGDTLNIAYYDVTNTRVKFIRTTNGGTSFGSSVVVDSGNVGQYLSLAAAEQGNAFVSYYDAANKVPKVARSTNGGASWTSAAVDSEQETGTYTGLVVPPQAGLTKLYVSYYDADDKDLRVSESRLLADLEGHRLSVRYRFNPQVVDSAVLRTGGPIQIAQKGDGLWHVTIPSNIPPGHEQAEIRVRMHVRSGTQPGDFQGVLSMEHVPD